MRFFFVHGNRIYATITKDLIYKLQGVFVEGEVYNLFFFYVVPNIGLIFLLTTHTSFYLTPEVQLFCLKTNIFLSIAWLLQIHISY